MIFSRLGELSFLFPEMAPNWQTFVAFDNIPRRVQILWIILCFQKDFFTRDLKKVSGYLRSFHNTREINALVCWCNLFKTYPPSQDFNIKIRYFKFHSGSIILVPSIILTVPVPNCTVNYICAEYGKYDASCLLVLWYFFVSQ